MIWRPAEIVMIAFRGQRRAAAAVARRWTRIAAEHPDAVADVIRLGNVLSQQPQDVRESTSELALTDAARLAYEAGQRDMALKLLALMQIGPHDLSRMTEHTYDPD